LIWNVCEDFECIPGSPLQKDVLECRLNLTARWIVTIPYYEKRDILFGAQPGKRYSEDIFEIFIITFGDILIVFDETLSVPV
jgi:hypothetical protein